VENVEALTSSQESTGQKQNVSNVD